jgi:ABC-type multidrug transport system fused ATPase/permease subunit
MQENVSGMRVVQIFNREDTNFAEYDRRNAIHRDEWMRQIRNFALYFPIVEFWSSLAVALIVLYGGLQILHGRETVGGVASIGMLFAYVQWADRLFGPIRTLVDKYNLIQDAMASSERVFGLLDTPEEIKDKPDAVPATGVRGEVEFRHVWFAYEPEQWVLKDVDFRIAPGERIAIVGHTGAGKSTLANLLSRFYDVPRGAVLVDGVDVRDYGQRSLRGNIGMVLQDVFLFSGTVMRNLRLGNEELSEERIRECAEYVNAARFIERLPGGYDYDVGERGGNLSTGQRQLLAFARTLAHDPRILVLDEATSSVDTETEMLIQDAIGKLMQGRTSIMIAHRLSTVQRADRIIVMHHGEIREMGTHQELLAKRGLYYTLYLLQYKDQNSAA